MTASIFFIAALPSEASSRVPLANKQGSCQSETGYPHVYSGSRRNPIFSLHKKVAGCPSHGLVLSTFANAMRIA
jgi:hypothetical protein